MRIALLSDIHGNLEALEHVLGDIRGQNVQRMVSLGDNIGYGPDSEAVVERLAALKIPSILGNHELALNHPKFLNWFNPQARRALEQNLDEVTDRTRQYCSGLPRSRIICGVRLVHGFPPHSPTLYSFQIRGQRMQAYFENAGESIAFIGHTHEPECIIWDGWNIKQEVLQRGIISLNPKCKYIINAGSVGQPRDGNNRAKYLIWDEARESLELRHVAYPVDVVIAKMAAKNYPAQYAERLR